MRVLRHVLFALLLVVLVFATWVAWMNRAPERAAATPVQSSSALVERGAYLARAGNCLACHTARGGVPYTGGRGIETPFGTVYAGNLTPAPRTGLGGWSAEDFWQALHHGRGRDGRLLNPAFPYTAFTKVTRDDSDALFAFLQSLPAQERERPAHALRFPYNQGWALAVWRALHFRPGEFQPDTAQDAAWNRGAYLVQGLGHCASCHAPRNALGGSLADAALGGGLMPVSGWYAPALGGAREAAELPALLRSGQSARGAALGPMAEVVLHSTQHLSEADLQAMARYLGSLPEPSRPEPAEEKRPQQLAARAALGAKLFTQHCASCHGEQGDGQGLYPPLAGNRSLALASPNNLIKAIRQGGFGPSTAANPRPFGMPPFGHLLSEAEIAAVATYLRLRWGQGAGGVTELQVLQTP